MLSAKKEVKINLLPQLAFEKGNLGRILKWLLSSFRVIVIFTEILVMTAFLSRFWLDAKNSDLNESLAQKKAIILSFAEIEKTLNNTQKRLAVFAKASSQTPVSSYIKTVVSYLPAGVQLKSVAQTQNQIQITVVSPSEQQIAQFLTNLESVKTFKEVALTQIDSDQENQPLSVFTIKISL